MLSVINLSKSFGAVPLLEGVSFKLNRQNQRIAFDCIWKKHRSLFL